MNYTKAAAKIDLKSLVEVLEVQKVKKYDVLVKTSKINASQKGIVILDAPVNGEKKDLHLSLTATAHSQVSQKLNIPKGYYDRMFEQAPELWENSLNTWFSNSNDLTGKTHFVRNFLGDKDDVNLMRAFLSDRFNPIDNFEVLTQALETIRSYGVKVQIDSCDITPDKMYVRLLCPEISAQAPKLLKDYHVPGAGKLGEVGVISGLIISNSETGKGTFEITPRLQILACSNGMIRSSDSFRKTHLGAKLENGINWSNTTQRKNQDLIISQTKDVLNTFLSKDYLVKTLADLEKEAGHVVQNPNEVIQCVTKELDLPETHVKDLLNYFIQGHDSTSFGVVQAVTYYAHAHKDVTPESRYDLESKAFEILPKIKKFDKTSLN